MAPLDEYRRKRTFDRTPEPSGAGRAPSGRKRPARDWTGRFVIQKHAATRLHFDFRLELDGVLVSWAVPRGPSLDPGVRRLAMKVEDHPLEYGDFEGVIPKGNYGAGEVIVWDRGTWRWDPDHAAKGARTASESLAKGKLHFALEGEKLHGAFVLARTGSGDAGRSWLLFKLRDEAATGEADPDARVPASVLTGRTLTEVAAGAPGEARWTTGEGRVVPEVPPVPDLDALLGAEAARARPGAFPPRIAGPALPTLARKVPEGDGWWFELKLDGVRALVLKDGDDVRLVSRQGNRLEGAFPELVRAVSRLAPRRVALDGEVCRHDPQGRPRFQLLQPRLHVAGAAGAERLSREAPAVLHVFDCLHLEGRDLRAVPLGGRRAVARALVPADDPVLRFSDHVVGHGPEVHRLACEQGLEGVVAKRAGTPYPSGRTRDWLKVKCGGRTRFVIGGYAEYESTPAGSLGGLLLGLWRGGDLVFVGGVGTGFDDRTRRDLRARLEGIARPGSPFREAPSGGAWPAGHRPTRRVWVDPVLVAECHYTEFTADGKVRHPSFQGLVDADPRSCTFPADVPADPEPALTRLDKVFFPADGITKGDLVAFYRAIAPALLPHLADRPMVMNRFPDGIAGGHFYQKNTEPPDWARTVVLHSQERDRDLNYVVVDDLPTLLWCLQMGCISLSPWSSRIASLDHPDYAIVDLDPGDDCPFEDVVAVARVVREVTDELGLRAFAKTSGATGIHVEVPLLPRYSYDEARTLAEIVAQLVAARVPRRTTLVRALAKRPRDRVYVDCLQNVRGKTVASVYSVRERARAPVSTPLRWEEVRPALRPTDFTIRNVPDRLRRLGDLWRPMIDDPQALEPALDRLGSARKG